MSQCGIVAQPTPNHRLADLVAHPTLQRRVVADLTAAVADPMAATSNW